ncbi:MAG: DUF7453 family protein [Candidatus Anammoxibacter sp.]
MKYKNIVFCSLFAVLVLPVFIITLYAQSYTIKVISDTETEIIPGLPLFGQDDGRGNLQINNRGDVLFNVFLSDGTLGIMLYSEDKTKLILKSVGAQPINQKAVLFLAASDINDNGEIVFCGNVSGKQGIYKLDGDNISPLTVEGDLVSGLEEFTIEDYCGGGSFSLNNNGEIAFSAIMSDGRNGLFMFTDGSIKPIAIEGDMFPLLSGSGPLVIATLPNINDKGEVVFRAAVTNLTRGFIDLGIYLFRDGEIIPVQLEGQNPPDINNKVFIRPGPPAIGSNSQVLFWATYIRPKFKNPHIEIGSFASMFSWTNGVTTQLILYGNRAFENSKDVFISIQGLEGRLGKSAINDFGEIVSYFNSASHGRGVMLFSGNKAIPVALAKYLGADANKTMSFVSSANINNNGDIVFTGIGTDNLSGQRYRAIFLATKENVTFTATEIRPDNAPSDSIRRLKVTGAGFQPGAKVSFEGDGIRSGIMVLSTIFKTSTGLVATIRIAANASPSFRDVIITNPDGEETVLEDGFEVKK